MSRLQNTSRDVSKIFVSKMTLILSGKTRDRSSLSKSWLSAKAK